MVTAGLKQIAGELGVSEITAKVYRGNVMRKMGARSLADLDACCGISRAIATPSRTCGKALMFWFHRAHKAANELTMYLRCHYVYAANPK